MFSIRVLFSSSYDPWFNLAAEDYLFRNMEEYQCILFLWRNCDTIVIGRAQNPWKECNTRRMERDGIKLARRSSGGGAVFHDLGNTCFTFMSKKSRMNEDENFSTNVLIDGLRNLGIVASLSGRNDVIVQTDLGERKISGSAYRKTSYGKLHHGTLLLNTDLNKLIYYLTPDKKKLTSKGISSVRSRITNLNTLQSDITHEVLCESLQESFFKMCNQKTISQIISTHDFSDNYDFTKLLLQQQSWEWNFGTVPNFTHHLNTRFMWGDISLYIDIKGGIIRGTRVFTDSLYPEPLESLASELVHLPYNLENVKVCCQKWIKQWSQQHPELIEVKQWLLSNMA